jgi:hypothetical protein
MVKARVVNLRSRRRKERILVCNGQTYYMNIVLYIFRVIDTQNIITKNCTNS